MEYKLIALDLDGTLLTSLGVVGERTKEVLHSVIAQGCQVILCTGRRYRTTCPIVEQLGLAPPLVLHNGLLVKEAHTGQTISQNYFREEYYHEIIALLRAAGHQPILYADRFEERIDFYIENDREGSSYYLRYVQENKEFYALRNDLHIAYPEKILQIGLLDHRDNLQGLYEHLRATFGTVVHTQLMKSARDDGSYLEIMNLGISKWQALFTLAQAQGISPQEILAIGDEINDREMIQNAGLGIAMGNAIPEIKAVADYVTETNDAEGVAKALERFVMGR